MSPTTRTEDDVHLTILSLVISEAMAPSETNGPKRPVASETTSVEKDRSPFRLVPAIVRADARVRVSSIEFDANRGRSVDELELSLDDKLSVTTYVFGIAVSYNPLPFLELSASTGFVTTETGFSLRVRAAPDGTLSDELDVAIDSDTDQSGYLLGFGAAVYTPLAQFAGGPLLLRSGASFDVKRFDTINSTNMNLVLSLVRTGNVSGVPLDFSLGTSYSRIDRDGEFTESVFGRPIRVRIEQELSDPWSMIASVSLPLDNSTRLTFITTQSFTGTSVHALRVSITP